MPSQMSVHYDLDSSPLEVRFVSEITRDGVQVFRGDDFPELLKAICHSHGNLLLHLYQIRRERISPR